MAKLTTTDLVSGAGSHTVINDNFELVETAMENTLSLDGTTPNSMSAQLDLGTNRIINVVDPVNPQDGATKKYADDLVLSVGGLAETVDADITADWSFLDTLVIRADIVTATPPVSETVLAKLNFLDFDKNDLLGFVGFNSSNIFRIDNVMHGGLIEFRGEDTGGTTQLLLTINPNTKQVLLPLENDAATPTLAFGDGDTGFYEQSDDVIGFATLGLNRFFLNTTAFIADNGAGPAVQNEAATSINPTLIPNRADANREYWLRTLRLPSRE